MKKNGQGRDQSYIVKKNLSDSAKKFSETDIIKMLEFLIDNICYIWWTCFSTHSRDTYGCKLCSSSRRLNALSYEAYFKQEILKKNENKLARSFNLTFRYIDDVLSLNNTKFSDFVDRIYPIELEIKETTDTVMSVSFLDIHFEIDSEDLLRTTVYDKRDDFNFLIVNFPFIYI
jgi:hypothetical protein